MLESIFGSPIEGNYHTGLHRVLLGSVGSYRALQCLIGSYRVL